MAEAIVEDPLWHEHAREATGRFIDSRLVETIAADMRRDCPIKSGRLLSTIRVKGNQIWVGSASVAPYWADVEYGTKPHMILPRNGKFLRWEGPDGPIFARKVHHPGTKAQPYIRPNFYKYRTAVIR